MRKELNSSQISKITFFLLGFWLSLSWLSVPSSVFASDDFFSVKAKVLLYHHITETPTYEYGPYGMSAADFREEMQWLSDQGWKSVTVSQMIDAILNETPLPEKTVVLTFDDGYMDVYENGFPILKEFGFVATAYLVGKAINAPQCMTAEVIKEMHEAGWEFGSHTMNHVDLMASSAPGYEICESKKVILEETGIDVLTFAYPYGSADTNIMDKVYSCGYTSGAGLGVWSRHNRKFRYFFARYPLDTPISIEQFKAFMQSE